MSALMLREASPSVLPAQAAVRQRWNAATWCAAALLVVGVLAALGRVTQCDFVNYDDPVFVTNNAALRAGLCREGLWWSLTGAYTEMFAFADSVAAIHWHPLVWWTFLADYELYGLAPWGYHLTNLLWHLGSTLLLFAALRRLTGATWRSFLVAALFAVHPLNVQPVAWVAERKGVVSTFFWMLTLWTYARYAERPSLARYALVAVSLALGLQAKQMLVTLPCVLLLLDFWPLRRLVSDPGAAAPASWRWLVVEKLPLIALTLAFALLMLAGQRGEPADVLPPAARVANALVSYVAYLGQFLAPMGFAIFYPHPGTTLPVWKPVSAALVLLAITGMALVHARRRPYLLVGWLWYVGTLLPVSGLVQLGQYARADRYAYVPMVGIFIAIAWGLGELAVRLHRERTVAAGSGLALVMLAAVSWAQVDHWRDSVRLWQHAVVVTGPNVTACHILGGALLPVDKAAALESFRQALTIDPDQPHSHHGIGIILAKWGDNAGAALHLRKALAMGPGDGSFGTVHYQLALVLAELGQRDEAAAHFEETLRCDPQHARAHLNLGIVRLEQGRAADAVAQLRLALALDEDLAPAAYHRLGLAYLLQDDVPAAVACLRETASAQPERADMHRELAHALHRAGRLDEAAEEYRQALALDPDWPETIRRQAWERATAADAARREPHTALRLARQVVEAMGRSDPLALDTLAAAHASLGDYAAATAAAQEALPRATARPQLVRDIEARLKLYAKHEPFRATGP